MLMENPFLRTQILRKPSVNAKQTPKQTIQNFRWPTFFACLLSASKCYVCSSHDYVFMPVWIIVVRLCHWFSEGRWRISALFYLKKELWMGGFRGLKSAMVSPWERLMSRRPRLHCAQRPCLRPWLPLHRRRWRVQSKKWFDRAWKHNYMGSRDYSGHCIHTDSCERVPNESQAA